MDIKKYFTQEEWQEMSEYEKVRNANLKRNYEMLKEAGKIFFLCCIVL